MKTPSMRLEVFSGALARAGRGAAGVARVAGIAGLLGVFVSACAGEIKTTPGAGAGGAAAGSGGVTVPPGGSGGDTRSGSGGSPGGAGASGSGGAGVAGSSGGLGGARSGVGGTSGVAGASGMGGAGGAGSMDPTAICARWTADRANLSEGTWSGATASCTAGDMSADARANALRLVNLYRWLAALPPVTTDPAHDAEDQACALMMRANNMISHMPPTTWLCYTAAGADGASNSNVSGGPAVSSVDLYMTDPGNPTTIGHRRWLLSNSLGPIGIGGTDRSSCLWTLTGTGKAGKPWMAWPPAGIVPVQAVFAGGTKGGADTTGWTVESDSVNLANAQVTVTLDGANMPVTVAQLLGGYGSKYAISFIPMGWTTQPNKTYSVSITGAAMPISYTVQTITCN
jgi:uncharacterized protein YkwD